jgi:hypothetical protein
MKNRFLLSAFFLFFPILVHAQVSETTLLNLAKTWVDTKLQCQQFHADWNKSTLIKGALGKCKIHGKPIFGHYHSPKSTGLILHVSGSVEPLDGGVVKSNEKYIVFNFSNGKLNAQVFYAFTNISENGSEAELVSFTEGSDLIWIGDGGSNCGTSEAHLFAAVSGKMKKILTYKYMDQCTTYEPGFETTLIPIKDRGLRLLKLTKIMRGEQGLKIIISESFYNFDKTLVKYKLGKNNKNLPFVQGYFDFWDHVESKKTGITANHLACEMIRKNKNNLDEVISFLKLDKNSMRYKRAHLMLTVMAGKDLGKNYQVWEKWENGRNEISPSK